MEDETSKNILDGINAMREEINSIRDGINATQDMVSLLIRQKTPQKLERLMDRVKEKGRIDTKAVMEYLHISRPHSISLMKKAGDNSGFKYSGGSQNSKNPSVLIFNKAYILQDQYKTITKLFESQNIVTLSDIMNALSIELPEAKMFLNEYIVENPEVEVREGMKLCLKSVKKNKQLIENTDKKEQIIRSDEL